MNQYSIEDGKLVTRRKATLKLFEDTDDGGRVEIWTGWRSIYLTSYVTPGPDGTAQFWNLRATFEDAKDCMHDLVAIHKDRTMENEK